MAAIFIFFFADPRKKERMNKTLCVWPFDPYQSVFCFFYSTETVSAEISMAEILSIPPRFGFRAVTLSGA